MPGISRAVSSSWNAPLLRWTVPRGSLGVGCEVPPSATPSCWQQSQSQLQGDFGGPLEVGVGIPDELELERDPEEGELDEELELDEEVELDEEDLDDGGEEIEELEREDDEPGLDELDELGADDGTLDCELTLLTGDELEELELSEMGELESDGLELEATLGSEGELDELERDELDGDGLELDGELLEDMGLDSSGSV